MFSSHTVIVCALCSYASDTADKDSSQYYFRDTFENSGFTWPGRCMCSSAGLAALDSQCCGRGRISIAHAADSTFKSVCSISLHILFEYLKKKSNCGPFDISTVAPETSRCHMVLFTSSEPHPDHCGIMIHATILVHSFTIPYLPSCCSFHSHQCNKTTRRKHAHNCLRVATTICFVSAPDIQIYLSICCARASVPQAQETEGKTDKRHTD